MNGEAVTVSPGALRVPGWMQWSALSGRGIRASLREGDVVLAFSAPLVFFVCFYVPLRRSMEALGIDYAQYLLPLIVVYAMFFGSMFAGDRAAREVAGGMATRLRSMPLRPWVPVAARMSANLMRAVSALAGALVIGAAFGFRFHSPPAALVFLVVVLAFGAALVICVDTLGTVTRNPELSGTILFGPQLLLIMTSTGFVPVQGFPGWIQPFVRNQPVSQVTDALRALADGRFTAQLGVAAIWIVGLLVVGAVYGGARGRTTIVIAEEALPVDVSGTRGTAPGPRPGGSLLSQSLIETGRLLRRRSRQPEVITSTLALPILLLLMYDLVLGKSLGASGGIDPIYGFVPMVAVAGAMYGVTGTGISLYGERESGLLRRFWVLPIHRSAALVGRLLAECGRAAVRPSRRPSWS